MHTKIYKFFETMYLGSPSGSPPRSSYRYFHLFNSGSLYRSPPGSPHRLSYQCFYLFNAGSLYRSLSGSLSYSYCPPEQSISLAQFAKLKWDYIDILYTIYHIRSSNIVILSFSSHNPIKPLTPPLSPTQPANRSSDRIQSPHAFIYRNSLSFIPIRYRSPIPHNLSRNQAQTQQRY